MRLTIFNDDNLDLLKYGIKENLENYSECGNDWLNEITSTPFQEFGQEIIPIELDMSFMQSSNGDVKNAKILYDSLKFLSDSQASEERLWASLTHGMFWDYMQYRWPFSKASGSKEQFIRKNYFFAHGFTRSLMTNALARLWWLGRLTYNPDLSNPYKYLDYIADDLNGKGFPLFGTNYSSNREILTNFFNGIFYFEKSNSKLSRKEFQMLVKYVNLIGGSLNLDIVSSSAFFAKKINQYLTKLRN